MSKILFTGLLIYNTDNLVSFFIMSTVSEYIKFWLSLLHVLSTLIHCFPVGSNRSLCVLNTLKHVNSMSVYN